MNKDQNINRLEKSQSNIDDFVNSLPFSEYHEFHKWIKNEGWYEAIEGEYDNFKVPNSCIRLTISELYVEFKNNN